MPERRLLALTEQIYDAGVGGTPWFAVCQGLKDLLGAQSATLMVDDTAAGRRDIIYHAEIPETAAVAYRHHYHKVDLWTNCASRLVASPGPDRRVPVFTSGRLVPDRGFLRSEFYCDFGRPLGLRYVVGTVPPLGAAGLMPVGLHRPEGAPPFGLREQRLPERLLPHLRRTMQIRHRLKGSDETYGLAALDALPTGALVVDADMRVLVANLAAETLAANRGLRLRRESGSGGHAGVFARCQRRADDAALASLVRSTALGGAHGGAVRLHDETGTMALAALVTPLWSGCWRRSRVCEPARPGRAFESSSSASAGRAAHRRAPRLGWRQNMEEAPMAAVTSQLAAYCASLDFNALPPAVQERARFLVLDLAGNILRGRHDAESTPALLAAARALGLAAGGAAVLGDCARYTPAGAALLNGALAHSLDFDDTHAAGTLHPGAPVIPAALAAAEMAGADGRAALSAIVAGYEVTCRLALALPGGDHYDRGYHPTATCGAFGAAAAAARVFGLSAGSIEDAFGIALSQSAGSLQFLANGAWTKRFQVGWSAMAGLSAAVLAREGFRGASEAFEGKAGFLRAYAPNPVPERALRDLGTAWELMNTAVKPYPSCRYGHACVDAAIALRAERGLEAGEIERVTMGLPNKGMLLVGAPLARKQNPQNVVDGQFSGPFVVACGLSTGRMGWDSYALLSDPAVRALLPKIRCEEDPEIQALFPEHMAGKLTVRARGQEFVRTVQVAKGEPENFLTEGELRAKFHGLADAVLGRDRAALLADAVLGLDRAPDVNGLMRLGAPMVAARLAGE